MIEHEAVPVLLVMPVQVSFPSSVSVTGSPTMAADVLALVSNADTVVGCPYGPVAALTFSFVATPTIKVDEALDGR